MCEELAFRFDEDNPSGYFSVGLLSTLTRTSTSR